MQIWRHLAGGDAGTGVWSDQRGRAWKWTPGQIRHTHNSFIPANLLTTFGLRLKWKWTQNNTSDPQGWCSSPDPPSCPQQGNSQIGGEPEFGLNNQSSNQCNQIGIMFCWKPYLQRKKIISRAQISSSAINFYTLTVFNPFLCNICSRSYHVSQSVSE